MDEDLEPIKLELRLSCADSAIEAMIAAIEAVLDTDTAGDTVHRKVRDLLATIAEARTQHEMAEVWEAPVPQRLLNLLSRVSTHPAQADQLLANADPAIASPALAHLWEAAKELDHLRVDPGNGTAKALVRTATGWQPVADALPGREPKEEPPPPEPWIEMLATDATGFHCIVARAVRLAKLEGAQENVLRRFRDLARQPTLRKLRSIVEDDRSCDEVGFAESAALEAVQHLGLLGEVTNDWVDCIAMTHSANLPEVIRGVARRVLDVHRRQGGRRPDTLTAQYSDRIAEIYEETAGRRITYTKTTNVHATPHLPRGPGLDFMLAALRLVDAGTTPHQAAEQIDRIRKARRKSGGPRQRTTRR